MENHRIERYQIDALWSSVGYKRAKKSIRNRTKGTFWRSTMIDMDSRCAMPLALIKSETDSSIADFYNTKAAQTPGYASTNGLGWSVALRQTQLTFCHLKFCMLFLHFFICIKPISTLSPK
ncbi:MAG: hypothetical protein KDH98_07960 [Calditrichaeota bacterium]|nr:hypothetical protein [Calditrichota bacterium]